MKAIPGGRRYLSLDDLDVLGLTRHHPDALGRGQPLDEVQREPDLLRAVRRDMDRERRPGRFLLTGSTNLLRIRRLSDSPVGRSSYLTLRPMPRCGQSGIIQCGAWEHLLETPNADWQDVVAKQSGDPEDWQALARRCGGFPVPAVHLGTAAERAI